MQAGIAGARARALGEALKDEEIRFKGEPGQAVQTMVELRRDGAEPGCGAIGGKGQDFGAVPLEAPGKDQTLADSVDRQRRSWAA